MRYDPANAPIPSAWLETDESERLDAILRYHKRAKEHGGRARVSLGHTAEGAAGAAIRHCTVC